MLGHCASRMKGICSNWFYLGGDPLMWVQTCLLWYRLCVLQYTLVCIWDVLCLCGGMCFVDLLYK